ncbi:MAG: GNAT family acetyltransferase [Propionibacteriaceae bacterium]|jgi:RimJ/RimL family protein N-acetyltransferase|nr:GNAT family acetyltransferase [Propionibacteriaceae bacterium]
MTASDPSFIPLADVAAGSAWLSPIAADDVEAVFQICQDPDIQRWTTLPSPYQRSDAVAFAADSQPLAWADLAAGRWSGPLASVGLSWGIRLGPDQPRPGLAGVIGLKWRQDGVWEIGWWLDRAARGLGLMTAAARAVLPVAFDPAGPIRADQIQWRARVGNQASRAVAERAGFRYAGRTVADHGDGSPLWSASLRAGQPIGPVTPWALPEPKIRVFEPADGEAVVALWRSCGLTRPWNDPHRDIARKSQLQPELFLVALADDQVVGSAMAGYDGHRGWIHYLAVAPAWRHQGLGRALMARVEDLLTDLGCPKAQLMVRADNSQVQAFYAALGYQPAPVVTLGRRLIPDV